MSLQQNQRKRKKRNKREKTKTQKNELESMDSIACYDHENPMDVRRYMIGSTSWINDIKYGSAPTPIHNFPQIFEPWERNPDYYHMIHEINDILQKLQVGQGVMYETSGYSDIKNTRKYRKFVSEKMKFFIQQLDNVPLVSAPEYEGGQSMETRDLLLNLGVAIFGSGIYLMMMSSHHAGDDISKAANYHLQKGIFLKNSTQKCLSCGHLHCMICDGRDGTAK